MNIFYKLIPHKHNYIIKSFYEPKVRCVSTVNENGEYGAKWLGTNLIECSKCGSKKYTTRLHGWLEYKTIDDSNEARFFEHKSVAVPKEVL
jgi:hypothetical protein